MPEGRRETHSTESHHAADDSSNTSHTSDQVDSRSTSSTRSTTSSATSSPTRRRSARDSFGRRRRGRQSTRVRSKVRYVECGDEEGGDYGHWHSKAPSSVTSSPTSSTISGISCISNSSSSSSTSGSISGSKSDCENSSRKAKQSRSNFNHDSGGRSGGDNTPGRGKFGRAGSGIQSRRGRGSERRRVTKYVQLDAEQLPSKSSFQSAAEAEAEAEQQVDTRSQQSIEQCNRGMRFTVKRIQSSQTSSGGHEQFVQDQFDAYMRRTNGYTFTNIPQTNLGGDTKPTAMLTHGFTSSNVTGHRGIQGNAASAGSVDRKSSISPKLRNVKLNVNAREFTPSTPVSQIYFQTNRSRG